jgi:hypothetical protein
MIITLSKVLALVALLLAVISFFLPAAHMATVALILVCLAVVLGPPTNP